MIRPLATALLAGALTACGSSSPDTGDATARAPATPALVAHADLAGFLPAPDGWTRGAADSAQVGLPAPASHASVRLTRGAAAIDVEITDTAGQSEYIEATAKIAGTDFERTAANGYFKGAVVGGFPAVESWNHQERLGEITILLEQRFVVHGSSTGTDDIAVLRGVLEAVNLRRLAAMKQPAPPRF